MYFERQQGSLCAQHALNNLLQDNIFTAVDLSEIARDLDSKELEAIADNAKGTESIDYIKAQGIASSNYDDSGYFSIQVLTNALATFALELTPFNTKEDCQPEAEKAFICNISDHWLGLRKFGDSANYWYDLNSTNNAPSHISATYLCLYLQQLTADGGQIYAIRGDFPQSNSDLQAIIGSSPGSLLDQSIAPTDSIKDEELEKALELSLRDGGSNNTSSNPDDDLQKALAISMEGATGGNGGQAASSMDAGRLLSDEDADLNAAIAASFEGVRKQELTIEEMRAARLAKMMPPDLKGKGKAT